MKIRLSNLQKIKMSEDINCGQGCGESWTLIPHLLSDTTAVGNIW